MEFAAFIFLFLNLFNPVSANITLLINIILYFIVIYKGSTVRIINRKELIYPIVLLVLALLSMSRYGTFDLTIIGRYGRVLISFLLLPNIVTYFAKSKCDLVKILITCLFLHCCMVLVQLVFPTLEQLNVALFRFERGDETLEVLTYRRLGLTGSFDVAGFYVAFCSILSYIRFVSTKNNKYMFILVISVVSSLFTSRTGMAMGLLGIGLAYLFYGKKYSSYSNRFLLLIFVFVIGFGVVYPIISGNFSLVDTSSNYGNSMFYLSNIHLLPLYSINKTQLFWGVGTMVSKVNNIYGWSDIGYVKQIFEVGLVGVIIMVFYCIQTCYRSFKKEKMTKDNQITILLLTVFMIVFNYKNDFLWQVGTFDLYLLVYYYNKSKSVYNGLL